jgi:uncharacterized protein DUF955
MTLSNDVDVRPTGSASALSFVGDILGVSDVLEFIEREAEALSKLGIRNEGAIRFTNTLLHSRGITGLRAIKGVSAAVLVPRGTGWEIHYNDNLPRPVLRFTVAHELAHTYFMQRVSGRPQSIYSTGTGIHEVIEYLCDRFAAALLLPREHFGVWLYQQGFEAASPRLDLLSSAARRFDVAPQAIARRCFYHFLQRSCAIVSVRRPVGTKNWCVSWFAVPGRLDNNVDGFITPFHSARQLPSEMIGVDWQLGATVRVALDSRWRQGVIVMSSKLSRRPLSRWPTGARLPGFACLLRGRCYVMFDV